MKHYPTKNDLPENVVIYPRNPNAWSDTIAPRPDAKPIGTYGKNRRVVYRREDMSELKSKTAWLRQGRYVLPKQAPVDFRAFFDSGYDLYGDWQTTDNYEVYLRAYHGIPELRVYRPDE